MMNGTLNDRQLAEVVGHMIRAERKKLLPGCDQRLFQLPCPQCIAIHGRPYTLILDLRNARYHCKLCNFDISQKEIDDAAREKP